MEAISRMRSTNHVSGTDRVVTNTSGDFNCSWLDVNFGRRLMTFHMFRQERILKNVPGLVADLIKMSFLRRSFAFNRERKT